jgi:hypothetical protein
MTTSWIKGNFSIKEGFEDKKKTTSPGDNLTQFLKSNPLKSIYDNKNKNARNTLLDEVPLDELPLDEVPMTDIDQIDPVNEVSIEPLDTIGGTGFDNIKGIAIPKEVIIEDDDDETTKNDRKKNNQADAIIISNMSTSFVTLGFTFFAAYNLYFNFIEVGKSIDVEKILNKLPAYAVTQWFAKIVILVYEFITTSIPKTIQWFINYQSFFKYRTLFVLLLVFSYFLIKTISSTVTSFIKGLFKQKMSTILGYIFNFKNNNKLVSLLFFFFIIKALFSIFTEPGSPILSFIVANPFLFLIALFIYIVVLYPITVSFSTFAITGLFMFYCFFSMIYFYFSFDKIDDDSSPFKGIVTFSDLLNVINNHLNFTAPVITGNANNIFEKMVSFLLNDIHYLYIFLALLSLLPSILKLHSISLQAYFFSIFGILIGLLSAFKIYGFSGIKEKIQSFF